MATRDLRFAADEKSIKNLAPTLVGKEMSFWENNQLHRGRVTAAEVARGPIREPVHPGGDRGRGGAGGGLDAGAVADAPAG